MNGERHWKSFHQYSREEVKEWLDVMRNASGKEYQVICETDIGSAWESRVGDPRAKIHIF